MADDGKRDGNDGCPMDGDVLVAGPTVGVDGRMFVRHREDHGIEMGVMRPVAEGESIGADAFYLSERSGDAYNVHPIDVGSNGPSKVNSASFRKNYDTIFGKKAPVGEA